MWACIAHCFHSLLGCWSSNGSTPPRRRLGPTWGSTSIIQRPVWETPGSEWGTANPLCCLRELTRITDSSESDGSFLIGLQPRIYGWINNSCHDVTLVDCRHRRPQQTWECCSCVCKDSQNVFYTFIIWFGLSRWHNFLKRLFLYSWFVRRVLWPLTATAILASRWQNMPIFHCTCFHNSWGRNSVSSALREYGRERERERRPPFLIMTHFWAPGSLPLFVWSCTAFISNDTASCYLFVCAMIEPPKAYVSWGSIKWCLTNTSQSCVKAKVY